MVVVCVVGGGEGRVGVEGVMGVVVDGEGTEERARQTDV